MFRIFSQFEAYWTKAYDKASNSFFKMIPVPVHDDEGAGENHPDPEDEEGDPEHEDADADAEYGGGDEWAATAAAVSNRARNRGEKGGGRSGGEAAHHRHGHGPWRCAIRRLAMDKRGPHSAATRHRNRSAHGRYVSRRRYLQGVRQ